MPMSQEEQVRLLSMVDTLEPLSAREVDELARRAPDTYLDEGEVLYTPQEAGEKLFILKVGRVQVYEMNPEGSEITLSVVESGSVFGGDDPDRPELPGGLRQGARPLLRVFARVAGLRGFGPEET